MGALTCASALVLAACGGGSDTTYVPVAVEVPAAKPSAAEALKPYLEQTVHWDACDSTILGAESNFSTFGDRLRCANIRVPLDYEAPDRGELSVAMMRLAGTDRTERRGALFFNPGGPGEDGLGATFVLLSAFRGSDPSTEQGRRQLQLLAQYDMIGFSPRGTGASTRLTCATNELQRDIDITPEGRTPTMVGNMLYTKRKENEACKRNPITPHINSDATARDMDLMRALVGDEKLNYVGYSYGTWLGAWYASRYPERVGRMVLDSSMDFTADGDRAEINTPRAVQRLMDEVYAGYAARHPDAFNLGATAADVRAALPGISPRVRGLLISSILGAMYRAENTDDALVAIAGARGLDQVMASLPGADEDTLAAAMGTHVFVPADPANNADARDAALALLHALFRVSTPSSIDLNGSSATYSAVMCNDTPGITNVDYWIDLGNQYALQYPLMGSMVTMMHCGYWGGPSVSKPPVSAMAGLDIMMVQSQYDRATDVEGALNAFRALPRGHLVYVTGESSHGLFPYQDQCVDVAVTKYLLGESPSARETTCSGHPLARDASTLRSASSASSFSNPVQASTLISAFKDGIARAASARDRWQTH